MATTTLLASDNFTRANENPLSNGGTWTTFPSQSALQIVSNVAEATNTSGNCGAYWNAVSWPADQISEATIGTASSSSDVLALVVRASTVNQSKYQVNIGTTLQILSISSTGSATVIKSSSATLSAGDTWTFAVSGYMLMVMKNGIPVLWSADASTLYSSGNPGVICFSPSGVGTLTLSAWRGYSAVQQDGIWTKQGCVMPPTSSDLGHTAANGTQNPSIIFEGNAQILSGNVYKMWFSGWESIYYAESTDGLNWSRRGSAVVANALVPCVFKNGSTYNLYCNDNTTNGNIHLYTSTDGITWTGGSTVFSAGTAGQWDDGFIFYFSPFFIDVAGTYGAAGTWYAYYSGNHSPLTTWHTGMATSPDGVTWTRYAGNPIITNFWGVVKPMLVNGTWYAWGQTNNTGQGTGAAAPTDPAEGQRMQSTNLTTWTNPVHSVNRTQYVESLNLTTGGNYVSFPVDVNGRAIMYSTCAVDDTGTTTYYYQIVAAVAPSGGTIAQILTQPENALLQKATDSFARGNENPLSDGGAWSAIPSQGNLQLASNLVEGSATGSCAMAFTTGGVGNDQYSSITLQTLASGSSVFPIVRAATGANTFYDAVIPGPTGSRVTTVSINKIVAGTPTTLLANQAMTPNVGDVITLQVVGNVITLFQNGFVIGQTTDNANSITSGFPGIGTNAATSVANAQISAWAGGNANSIPSYSGMTVGSYLAGPLSVTMTNANGNSLLISGESVSGTFGHPIPVVFTDINGNEYSVTGQSAGAFVANPLPVVMCTAGGQPVTPPIVITSNGNTITISSSLSGKTTGAPTPVTLTQAGNQLVLSGFPLGSFYRNPLPVVLTDLNGNGVSISNIAT